MIFCPVCGTQPEIAFCDCHTLAMTVKPDGILFFLSYGQPFEDILAVKCHQDGTLTFLQQGRKTSSPYSEKTVREVVLKAKANAVLRT